MDLNSANVKIRNLPNMLAGETTSGNYVPVALNPDEGVGLGQLNPIETRKATLAQIVSGGAVSANFSEHLMVSGVSVSTGADADGVIRIPPHEYADRFSDTIVVGDQNQNFLTPITFRIGEKQMMRIDSNGVAIGEDSIYFSDASISDKNLKDEIFKINNSVEILKSLNGVNFIWNENAPDHKKGQRDIGLIAQEVEKIIPSAVQENAEGNLTVSYGRIIPVLVEAVKKQQKVIENLEQRIKSLERNK